MGTGQQRAPTGWRKYRRLFHYVVADGKGWALIAGVTLLSSVAVLLQPWPMQVLIDHVLGAEPMTAPLAWVVRLLPGGSTARGLLVWVVLAGLGVFALTCLTDVILARAWIRVG